MNSKSKSSGKVFRWGATMALAASVPAIPFVYVWTNREPDRVAQVYASDQPVGSDDGSGDVERVLLVTVEGWPTQAEVVYVEDPSESGATPVANEFKAETVSNDMFNALMRRGIEVERTDISEAAPLTEVKEKHDAVVFIYPARHKQLPWQLTAYFDESVEPLVAKRKLAEVDVPVVGMVLGDTRDDTSSTAAMFRELMDFSQLSLVTHTEILPDVEIFERYRESVQTAEAIVKFGGKHEELD